MNGDHEKKITALELKVAELTERCEQMSIDAVTGVSGRGVVDRELDHIFAQTKRFGRSLGVMMIDLDNFKAVNDTHGHDEGDRVLRQVAQVIQGLIRATDTFARYGGEEFIVLVDAATAQGLVVFAEKVRLAVEVSTPVTASIGTAIVRVDDQSPKAAVKRADEAMYRAKHDGKNRSSHG